MSKTRTTFAFGAERRTVEIDDNEQQAYSALVDKFSEFMLFFVAVHRQHDLLGLGSENAAGGVNPNPDETTAPGAMGVEVDRQSRAPFIEMLVAIMHDLAVVPKKYKTLWRNNTLAHLIAELQYCTTIPTYKTFRAYRKPAPPSPPAKSRQPITQSRHIAFDVFQGFHQSSYSTPSTSILGSPVRPRSHADAQMQTQAHTHGHTNPSRVPLRRQGAFVGLAHLEEVIDALPERTWTTRQPGTSVDGNDLTGPPPPLIRDPPPKSPPETTTTAATTAPATTADGGTASASRTKPSSQPPVVPLASTSKPSALPAATCTSPSTKPHNDAINPRRPLRRDFSSNSVPTLSLNGIPVKPHMTISISSEEEVVAIVSSHASSREEKRPRGRRTTAVATDAVPTSRKRRRDDLDDVEDVDDPGQASTSKSRAKSKSKSKDTSGGERSGTISQPHHSSFGFASEGETSLRLNPPKKARGSAVKRGRGSTRTPRSTQSQTAKEKQSQMAIGEEDEDETEATMARPTMRSRTRVSTRASTRTETPAEASQEQEGSQTRRRSTRLKSQPGAEKAKG